MVIDGALKGLIYIMKGDDMNLRGTPLYYHAVLKRLPPKSLPPFEEEDMQVRVWGRRWGVFNDVGTLRVCAVHRPGKEILVMTEDHYDPDLEALIDENEMWYFRSDTAPNLKLMQEEHGRLVKVLQENGVDVVPVDGPPRDPSAVFIRDAAIAVKGGAIICRMGLVGGPHGTGRRGEEAYITRALVSLGMPILHTIHGEGLLEGGSFCFIDERHAAVGMSYRQNAAGVDQLETVLRHQGVELIRVPLTGYSLHLDRAIVMIDHDKALVDVTRLPYWFLDQLHNLGIETIDCDPHDNEMTINCLAIAPGKVIMCSGSDRTAEALSHRGVDVIQIPYDENHKNGGGIHCSTLPLVRDQD